MGTGGLEIKNLYGKCLRFKITLNLTLLINYNILYDGGENQDPSRLEVHVMIRLPGQIN
jgi:hypothetical protein